MSKRNEWEFTFERPEVTAAAQKKLEYHKEREEHWRAEATEAEKEFRETGIDIPDIPIVDILTNSYGRVTPNVDQKKLDRVHKAQAKVREHQEKQKEFNNFITGLRKQSGFLSLTVDDIEFFGL